MFHIFEKLKIRVSIIHLGGTKLGEEGGNVTFLDLAYIIVQHNHNSIIS